MSTPILSGTDLQVRFRNGALGVVDVTVEVHEGTTVALLGPNGAGKTTTIRSLSGYLGSEGTRVAKGRVTFAGQDITNVEPHRAARLGVVAVPERRKIFANLTVTENLAAIGRQVPRARRVELLDTVRELFPILSDRRNQPAGQLSGGEQQMLAIGRALMSEAKVLLVDEMTLGLHASLKPVLHDAVVEINKRGTAVLIADESADFALSLADYCYLIRDGVISGQGRPDELESSELAVGYLG